MSSLVQFVKSMRSYLEPPRIQLIFLRNKTQGNHEIKGQRRHVRYVQWPWTFYFQQKIIVIEIARHLIGAMASSTTKNTKKKKKKRKRKKKKKKKRRSKRRKLRKLFYQTSRPKGAVGMNSNLKLHGKPW